VNPLQFELLARLVRTALNDQTRAYSATWSVARLRTLLVHQCLRDGHQVVEQPIPGTPSYRHHAAEWSRPELQADLKVILAKTSKQLFINLRCGSEEPEHDSLSVEQLHRDITRLSRGELDAVLISSEAQPYERLRDIDTQKHTRITDSMRFINRVLPEAGVLNMRQPSHTPVGDLTIDVAGAKTRAFGLNRLVAAIYVQGLENPR
jgi:hypothetical protein